MEENSTALVVDLPSEEPSFSGRLQLKNFMFVSNSDSESRVMRRSPRLAKSPSTVSASPSPPTPSSQPSAAPPVKKPRPAKRKAEEITTTTTTTITTTTRAVAKPPTLSASPAKRSRSTGGGRSSGYAPPSMYAHLPGLPDAVAPNMLIFFIGLNPGIETARTGHAYAHPSNLFWKLLYSSGITPVPCRAAEDRGMPERYGLGLTNIVARPSRSGAELSRAEMDAGVAELEAKCARWRPEVACVVGKSIWESIFRVRRGRPLAKGEFRYGWQGEDERMGVVEDEDAVAEGGQRGRWEGARVFVSSSTSGLAASLRPEEKERIWKELGDWCVRRRKERENAAAAPPWVD
ncbi:hypothetical protein DL766_002642 [Monosporascus sp. MC13-8B]|uniref:Uracil-DNA glycosylase-like domain-containing protein n=1 Tax=Monosporascus cannonballus TaxID=155416 RepID=A0ABY0HG71_9PEZI|nr:hypothetical protein DL762_003048 [Monosporascus cannonballus]RYO90301.1 hypothetical protein DL763_005385 [Monosporascus cannonballus]RYP35195.1 hypothetical protein DL766_002642 [Monosporascus sp. MC13-8B]